MTNIEWDMRTFSRLRNLESGAWCALMALIANGGSGDYTIDCEPLVQYNVIKRIGPVCYVRAKIDGVPPVGIIGAQKSKNYMAPYFAVWQRLGGKAPDGPGLGALRRFANNYSVEEFERMIKRYVPKCRETTPNLHDMWTARDGLKGKTLVEVFKDDFEC